MSNLNDKLTEYFTYSEYNRFDIYNKFHLFNKNFDVEIVNLYLSQKYLLNLIHDNHIYYSNYIDKSIIFDFINNIESTHILNEEINKIITLEQHNNYILKKDNKLKAEKIKKEIIDALI